jgi:hypothetical protein
MFQPLLRHLRLRHQNFGAGLRRPFRGRAFGGMLGATARNAPARLATPPNGSATTLARHRSAFLNYGVD